MFKGTFKIIIYYVLAFFITLIIWNIIIENYIYKDPCAYLDSEFGKLNTPNRDVLWGLEGFSSFKTDSLGFNNNKYDMIKKKKRILVIGDSFTEAIHVNREDNYCSKLKDLLGSEYEVINLGLIGQSIADYINNANNFNNLLNPDFVIIQVTSYRDFIYEPLNKSNWLYIVKENDKYFVKSQEVLNSFFHKIIGVIKKSSGISAYSYRRLKKAFFKIDTPKHNNNIEKKISIDKISSINNADLIKWEISELKKSYNNLIFLNLSGFPFISKDNISIRKDDTETTVKKKLLRNILHDENIKLIEFPESLLDKIETERKFLTGFNNTTIGSEGHLNEYGHNYVAELIYKEIFKEKE